MIRVNYQLDLDQFLSSGHLQAETVLVTTEYISDTNMLVYQTIGETTQALTSALLSMSLNVKTGLCNEYFFYKKTYGTDKPKNISKESFLERIGAFKHDKTDISQETLLKYRYNGKHGQDGSANIVINRYKNSKSTAYVDFASVHDYVNFCPPGWLTRLVESHTYSAASPE